MRLNDDASTAPTAAKSGAGAPLSTKAREQQVRQPLAAGAMASAFAKLKR
jgi:hypothetical protein